MIDQQPATGQIAQSAHLVCKLRKIDRDAWGKMLGTLAAGIVKPEWYHQRPVVTHGFQSVQGHHHSIGSLVVIAQKHVWRTQGFLQNRPPGCFLCECFVIALRPGESVQINLAHLRVAAAVGETVS